MKLRSLVINLSISLLGLIIATGAWTEPLPPPEAEAPEPVAEEAAVPELSLEATPALEPLTEDDPREWIAQGPGPAIDGQVVKTPGYFHIRHHLNGQLLTADFAGKLYTTSDSSSDTVWLVEPIGGDMFLRLMQKATGRVLDGPEQGKADTNAWSKASSQVWAIRQRSDKNYLIVQNSTRLALEADADNKFSTAAPGTDTPAQGWTFERIDDIQYFWIMSSAKNTALAATSFNDGSITEMIGIADTWDQLWILDKGPSPILNRDSGRFLDINTAHGICVNPGVKQKSSQMWTFSPTGELSVKGGLELATVGTDGRSVTAGPKSGSQASNQTWYLRAYVARPDTSDNQLPYLAPGAKFALRSVAEEGHAIALTAGPDAPLSLVASPVNPKPEAIWTVPDFVNYPNSLLNVGQRYSVAIDDSGTLIGADPGGDQPPVSWSFTGDGFLVDVNAGQVAELKDNQIRLSDYDPLWPVTQLWQLEPIEHEIGLGVRDAPPPASSPGPVENITKIRISLKLANYWFAGTTDQIQVAVGNGHRYLAFDGAAAGHRTDVEIDLQKSFGKSAINLSELTHVYIYQVARPHPIASDDWKLQSLIVEVLDEATEAATNWQYDNIGQWISARATGPAWVGVLPPGEWMAGPNLWSDEKNPVDLELETYSVGFMPWFGDIRHWRRYDPSKIEGVGQLVGMLNGRLVGELLVTHQCEELQPTDSNHSYIWVYVPNDTILYKLWDHRIDKSKYVAHSQLGSGSPVTCAGEMEVERQTGAFNQITDFVAMVNDASGHYKPDGGSCLRHVQTKLQRLGIPTEQITWRWQGGPD